MTILQKKSHRVFNANRMLLLSGGAYLLMVPVVGYAQSTQEAGNDIIVTARRSAERLQDVPISISVLSQEEINRKNITTASDLAIYTPSLSVNTRFGPDKSAFVIRGFNQIGKTAPTVAVYLADVPAIRSNSGTGASNGTGPGAFFDLQNLQVLKGPQGTLFGRNSTGGAILLVPNKPSDRLEGYVEGSVGNYDLRRIQAVLNLPLADTLKVRLGIDHQVRDGYLRNRSGIGPADFNNVNYVAVRGSIVFDVTPDLENYTVASYNKSDVHGFLFAPFVCNPNAVGSRARVTGPLTCTQLANKAARGDGFYDVENSIPQAGNKSSQWQVINTTTWNAPDTLTVKNILSYGELRDRYIGSPLGDFWIMPSGPQAGRAITTATIGVPPGGYSAAQSAFTEEFQLQGNTGNLKWQAGVYYELTKPIETGDRTYSGAFLTCTNIMEFRCATSAPLTAFGGLGLVDVKIKNRSIGLYAQGTYSLTEQLAITAGLRYSMDKATGNGGRLQLTFPSPNTPTVSACATPKRKAIPGLISTVPCDSGTLVQESKKPTWVVDVEYKPTPDALLYAKYSRGYRAGGLDPVIFGAESWRPETVDNFEVGSKLSFDGTFNGYLNVAGFYSKISDQQLQISLIGKSGSGIGSAAPIVNVGKSRIWGLEADAGIEVFEGLKLDAGYAYLNTKLEEYTPPFLAPDSPYGSATPVAVGGRLPLAPEHRVTLSATYALPIDERLGELSISANYVYTSSQETSDRISNPYSTIGASNLLNANIDWRDIAGKPLDIALFVTNLTKSKYVSNIQNNWGPAGYEVRLAGMPRMYGVRVKVRFGS